MRSLPVAVSKNPVSKSELSSADVEGVVCADAIEFLAGYSGEAPKLIFADPPFNIGYKYDRYKDELPYEAYVHWTTDWMRACSDALDPAGSFYVAIGDEYAAEVRLAGRQLDLTLRNWIIWHYTFGQSTRRKFARAHAHIFYFVKDPRNFTFDDGAIRMPSDRQLLYNDRRANPKGKLPDDVWTLCRDCARKNSLAGGDAATDIWLMSRVCGTFKEREQWHPCQMPEKLLERIIRTSSNPGDLVFDPFAGSGTTLAAAKRLGRRYLGTDISRQYVRKANQRLRQTRCDPSRVNAPLEPIQPPEPKRLAEPRHRPGRRANPDTEPGLWA